MAAVLLNAHLQLLDANGDPYSGAKAYFYLTGTTTATDTYTESTLTTPHTNPVIADATGTFAPIYLDSGITYKIVFKDSDDVTLYTVDPSAIAASSVADVSGPASSTDNAVARFSGTTGKTVQNSGVIVDDSNNVTGVSSLSLVEKAAAEADVAGSGQFWVKNDAPNTAQFTDDAGTDFQLATLTGTETLTNKTLTSAKITTGVEPTSSDGAALGTTTKMFSDLFLASGGVVNFDNGNMTITHAAGTLTLAGGPWIVPSAGLQVGSSVPFSDAAGTLTLQNVDAIDATTETTIEAAIDTLLNLTSVQGFTFTLADAGANAIFGWDDTAGAYENLTAAEVTAVVNAFVGDSGAGGTKGSVPAPVTGDSSKFLKGDGTWTAIAGGGDMLAANNLSDVANVDLSRGNLAILNVGPDFGLAASVAANALTVALKRPDGADASATSPMHFSFRSATAATGTPQSRTLSAALSLTVSSGSTLGAVSAASFRLWIVLFDDAGTLRLGVIKPLVETADNPRIATLDDSLLVSSTAEGGAGAADSAGVFYTGSAVTTKPYIILGYLDWDSGLTTAGTWDAGPTRIRLFGPGVKKPNDIVQKVRFRTGSRISNTTTVPFDATIPQNTEGHEVFTQAFTPTAVMNRLEIHGNIFMGSNVVNNACVMLFQDTTADAIATSVGPQLAAGAMSGIPFWHEMKAGTVSSTTFKMRIGGNAAGNTDLNGLGAGSAVFGGTLGSGIEIEEIMV